MNKVGYETVSNEPDNNKFLETVGIEIEAEQVADVYHVYDTDIEHLIFKTFSPVKRDYVINVAKTRKLRYKMEKSVDTWWIYVDIHGDEIDLADIMAELRTVPGTACLLIDETYQVASYDEK